ncbi:MAG TPA: hypothetical protein ENN08_00470 [Bacteroidales bacterium]|nr:hypothetical protein [Bacteroidales bacterium]
MYSYQVTAVYENNNESAPSNTVKDLIMRFQGGSGTPEDPYLIATAGLLDVVRLFHDAHYLQIVDIDLGMDPWNTGEGWEPIGGSDDPFTGSYNGSGLKIQNLYINKPDKSLIGLFGDISNSTVKHLTIKNTQVAGKYQVGCLAGSVSNGATIEYVKVLNADMLLE